MPLSLPERTRAANLTVLEYDVKRSRPRTFPADQLDAGRFASAAGEGDRLCRLNVCRVPPGVPLASAPPLMEQLVVASAREDVEAGEPLGHGRRSRGEVPPRASRQTTVHRPPSHQRGKNLLFLHFGKRSIRLEPQVTAPRPDVTLPTERFPTAHAAS